MAARQHLDIACKQIEFAREYTLSLIGDVAEDEWFSMPAGAVTNLAWQLGHLAVAQYGLCLFRTRGRQAVDQELMPSAFRKRYSKGTTPDPDPAENRSPAEIRSIFDRVHQQSLQELAQLTDQDLTGPVDRPYAVEPTQLGGLYFCALHEMIHAGQIGLLRRCLGKEPVR